MRYLIAIAPIAAVAVFACSTFTPRRLWAKKPGSQSTLFAFEQSGRVGFIDRNGKVVIPATIETPIERVGDFSEGLARVGGQGYIGQTGRWVIKRKSWGTTDFSDGVAWAEADGKERHDILLDRTGRTITIRPRSNVWAFSEGLAAFEAPGKPGIRWREPGNMRYRDFPGPKGFLNKQGQVLIEPVFAHVGPFREGLALAVSDGYCHIALPYGFRQGSPTSGYEDSCGSVPADAVAPCSVGFIDHIGRFVIEARFESARDFQEHLAAVRIVGRWGFIDAKGAVVIPPQFDEAQSFSEGFAAVKVKGKWGFVDARGKIAIPPVFASATPFSDALALVYTAQGAFFIDRQGRTAIPGPFKEATPFVNGLASVLLSDTRVAYIDHSGKTVFQYSRQPSRFPIP